ncbi:hypothetical protein [Streptomyces sp. enrichment culture]|uniref:hypothetical protein n=1 Tax=Streptomyces sp. enrichment culture TaxID=1795815 RepID=UPI003F57EBAB
MSGGSARPKRRKAAPASLRYEHRRVRLPGPKERDRGWILGCLGMLLSGLVIIVPVVMVEMTWGVELWGETADDWPGRGYGMAATVGALVPPAFAAFVAPLTRMNWARSKVRSLAWACAALPGLLACQALGGLISGVLRPKRRRDWDAECYSEGHACWIHVHYPWVWLVGLLTTLAVGALLVAVLVRYAAPRAEEAPAS